MLSCFELPIAKTREEPSTTHDSEIGSMILFTLRCTRGHQFEGWFSGRRRIRGAAEIRRDLLSRMRRNQGRKGGNGAATRQAGPPAKARLGGDRRPWRRALSFGVRIWLLWKPGKSILAKTRQRALARYD